MRGAVSSALVVAHRGFSAVAPENTLVALRMAVAAGATACEFDVRRTADGAIVLMHDKSVDRTTDGTGEVAKLSLAGIRDLDAGSWKSPHFAGERVPTLREALLCLKGLKAHAVVEIKDRGIGATVAREIADAGMAASATVISFDVRDLAEARGALRDVQTGLLESKARSPSELVSATRACGARIVDLDHRTLSPEFVRELKASGFAIWTWTVNESAMMRALASWGVTAITTDNPYRGASVFARTP
jgi:glycerophosphoryl diester phosphodiesterase